MSTPTTRDPRLITDLDLALIQRERGKTVQGGGTWQAWTRILESLREIQRRQQETA